VRRDHPKRKATPARVKREVRERQKGLCGCRDHCGAVLPPDGKGLVQYQHDPALGIRPINDDYSDWIPPQHDPAYIYAELKACHARETNQGKHGAAKIGSDRYEIDKMKRHERPPKPKRTWQGASLKSRNTFGPKGSRPFRKRTKP
jgi:hypothetical protein